MMNAKAAYLATLSAREDMVHSIPIDEIWQEIEAIISHQISQCETSAVYQIPETKISTKIISDYLCYQLSALGYDVRDDFFTNRLYIKWDDRKTAVIM